MADEGWIKVYRKLRQSFVWTDANQLKLWLLVLMKASHSGNRFLFNGKEITVSSGQFVTGGTALASEFNQGVTPDKQVSSRSVWRWIKKFEKEKMLSIKSTAKYSVITVCNWSEYQDTVKQVSSSGQAPVKQVTTIKNAKNAENAKKELYVLIVDYLNKKTGKEFKSSTKKTQSLINARLNEGWTKEQIMKVIDIKSREWRGTEQEQYLRPETLFGTKFESYLNQETHPEPRASKPLDKAAAALREIRDEMANYPGVPREEAARLAAKSLTENGSPTTAEKILKFLDKFGGDVHEQ